MLGRLSPEEWRPLIPRQYLLEENAPKLRLKAVQIIGIPFLHTVGASFALFELNMHGCEDRCQYRNYYSAGEGTAFEPRE